MIMNNCIFMIDIIPMYVFTIKMFSLPWSVIACDVWWMLCWLNGQYALYLQEFYRAGIQRRGTNVPSLQWNSISEWVGKPQVSYVEYGGFSLLWWGIISRCVSLIWCLYIHPEVLVFDTRNFFLICWKKYLSNYSNCIESKLQIKEVIAFSSYNWD